MLVLGDPYDVPLGLPHSALAGLTALTLQAEGLLLARTAQQFAAVLSGLRALRRLALVRLQLPVAGVAPLTAALGGLPELSCLELSGGAPAPVGAAELAALLSGELRALESLELSRLGVRSLPHSLSALERLSRLSFNGEMLRNVTLRDELRGLSGLRALDISANLAEQLPGGVLELTALRELHAGARAASCSSSSSHHAAAAAVTMQPLQQLVLYGCLLFLACVHVLLPLKPPPPPSLPPAYHHYQHMTPVLTVANTPLASGPVCSTCLQV